MSFRPQYTAEQLQDNAGSLPGFMCPGDIFKILENRSLVTQWQSVLSATVIANLDGDLHVLTGVRIAEGNSTHINVASTPTMRIPNQDAHPLLEESIPFNLRGAIRPTKPFISHSLRPSVAVIPDSTDPLAAKVGNLLALKLELGQQLERTR